VSRLVSENPIRSRSKAVKQFVESTHGRLRLFVLPAYSPQLNPDEWVWKNVKHDRVGRTSVTEPFPTWSEVGVKPCGVASPE